MRKIFFMMAAVLAAIIFFLLVALPPQPKTTSGVPEQAVRDRTVAGAFHVHSTRSDGAGDKDTIATAAARAGLQFVVMTDHGDGTRAPDPPEYLHGVLCIDAVEISTDQGHYIALDMPASPYPLGGAGSAVVEDVKRLGGFGVVAHPDSAKAELSWSAWAEPVDGLEWLNADSEWRHESRRRLAGAVVSYVFRPAPVLASIFDRPESTLSRWDALTQVRPVVALAGHDAHGGVGRRAEDPTRSWSLPLPSYTASFRTFAIRTILSEPPTGRADRDARLVLDAVRTGRVFTAIDAVAQPAWIDFRVRAVSENATIGQSLMYREGSMFTVQSALPVQGRVVLRKGGVRVAESSTGRIEAAATGPGAYRVEVLAPGSPGVPPIPWLVTNPIYLRETAAISQPSDPALEVVSRVDGAGRVESDPGSRGSITSGSPSARVLEYQLRPGERVSQYAALVLPLRSPLPAFDRIVFAARSDAPMRLSVQLRFDARGGERWGRSTYVSPGGDRIIVPLADLQPLDDSAKRSSVRPDFTAATSLLFVVDLTNAAPGSKGRVDIAAVGLARPSGR
jgi:hypothetical protein